MIIEDVMSSYENLKVKIKGKWYYMKHKDLIGAELKNKKIVKKRVRTWIEDD